MKVRGIPEGNLCVLHAPAEDVVTRKEFDRTIWNPLWIFLQRWQGRMDVLVPDGIVRLRVQGRRPKYLVPVYGVPVKVSGYEDVQTMHMSRAAAVDSELALLPGYKHDLVGPLANPYHGAMAAFGPPLDERMVLVSRLDGPSAKIARRLVDDAVWAETHGLKGRAYVDTRGLTEGNYAAGDATLRGAASALRRAGFETEVDERPEIWPLAHPMPEAAVYFGWYSEHAAGPMTALDFRFQRGAVAYHLQSFSGADPRDPNQHWVGPLLAHGACATAGAVYEPGSCGVTRGARPPTWHSPNSPGKSALSATRCTGRLPSDGRTLPAGCRTRLRRVSSPWGRGSGRFALAAASTPPATGSCGRRSRAPWHFGEVGPPHGHVVKPCNDVATRYQ